MAKHDEKKDKKRKKDLEREESNHRTTARNSSYVDGHALDEIQYLEAKLILKPDRFTSVESFRDFGKIVKRAAKETDVDFIADPQSGLRPDIREILFADTPDFRLYNHAFILRRRISYVDGFPVGDPEIVFKYRHPDQKVAAAVDVRPNIAGKYRIKFKAEALPLKERIGSYRILYSHNCQFGLSQIHDADKTSLLTLTRVFPALGDLKHSPDEHVTLVSEAIVEEVLLKLGELDFGKGQVGKCDVALWRTRGEHKPLVGEFAFQIKFERREDVHEKARKRAEQFFITLQQEAESWLSLGTTKTGMVYRLKGNAPQSHE
ncbi:MAG TPA: hypothetical protein VHM93_13650 [Candidatus Acidoferrum sp.]|jgi:hypothetical protein|nr:hypothetical protein [Candidatus Acidoferrum sp.]